MNKQVHTQVAVTHQIKVFDRNGNVVGDPDPKPKPNLVLDQGLDMLDSYHAAEVGAYLHTGDDATPTKVSSGAITVSISGTDAVASGNLFTEAMATNLREIAFPNGDRVKIVGYTSPTEVTVQRDTTMTNETVLIYSTEQTALFNQTDVSDTVVDGASHNYTRVAAQGSYVSGIHARHHQSAVYPAGTTVRELGLSPDGVAGNLFARWVPEDPIVIPAGGYFEDIISVVAVTDTSDIVLDTPITGIPINGIGSIVDEYTQAVHLMHVASDGSITMASGPEIFVAEPYTDGQLSTRLTFRADDDTEADMSTATLGGTVNEESAVIVQPYVAGTFQREVTATMLTDVAPAGWRSVGLIDNVEDEWVYRILWESTPVLTLGKLITMRFIKSWGRG